MKSYSSHFHLIIIILTQGFLCAEIVDLSVTKESADRIADNQSLLIKADTSISKNDVKKTDKRSYSYSSDSSIEIVFWSSDSSDKDDSCSSDTSSEDAFGLFEKLIKINEEEGFFCTELKDKSVRKKSNKHTRYSQIELNKDVSHVCKVGVIKETVEDNYSSSSTSSGKDDSSSSSHTDDDDSSSSDNSYEDDSNSSSHSAESIFCSFSNFIKNDVCSFEIPIKNDDDDDLELIKEYIFEQSTIIYLMEILSNCKKESEAVDESIDYDAKKQTAFIKADSSVLKEDSDDQTVEGNEVYRSTSPIGDNEWCFIDANEVDGSSLKTLIDNISWPSNSSIEDNSYSSNGSDTDDLSSSNGSDTDDLSSSNNSDEDDLCSSNNSDEDDLCSSNSSGEDALCSSDNSDEDALCSSNNSDTDDLCSFNNSDEDALCSSNNSYEDALCSSNHSDEDALCSSNHSDEDDLCSSDSSNEDDSSISSHSAENIFFSFKNFIKNDDDDLELGLGNEIILYKHSKKRLKKKSEDFILLNELLYLKNADGNHKRVLCDEEIEIMELECKTFHQGHHLGMHKFEYECNRVYFKIPRDLIRKVVSECVVCSQSQPLKTKEQQVHITAESPRSGVNTVAMDDTSNNEIDVSNKIVEDSNEVEIISKHSIDENYLARMDRHSLVHVSKYNFKVGDLVILALDFDNNVKTKKKKFSSFYSDPAKNIEILSSNRAKILIGTEEKVVLLSRLKPYNK
nr:unnamed protein product [Papilio xuthus]